MRAPCRRSPEKTRAAVRISVDLPAPLGPSSPTALPVPAAPRRQVIPAGSPPSQPTFRFSSSTTGMVSKDLSRF